MDDPTTPTCDVSHLTNSTSRFFPCQNPNAGSSCLIGSTRAGAAKNRGPPRIRRSAHDFCPVLPILQSTGGRLGRHASQMFLPKPCRVMTRGTLLPSTVRIGTVKCTYIQQVQYLGRSGSAGPHTQHCLPMPSYLLSVRCRNPKSECIKSQRTGRNGKPRYLQQLYLFERSCSRLILLENPFLTFTSIIP